MHYAQAGGTTRVISWTTSRASEPSSRCWRSEAACLRALVRSVGCGRESIRGPVDVAAVGGLAPAAFRVPAVLSRFDRNGTRLHDADHRWRVGDGDADALAIHGGPGAEREYRAGTAVRIDCGRVGR